MAKRGGGFPGGAMPGNMNNMMKQVQKMQKDMEKMQEKKKKKEVESVMNSGSLVSDDLIISVIKERVKKEDCSKGYILDGFPRTVPQAEALDKMLAESGDEITKIICFALSEDTVLKRLKTRQESENRADDSASVQIERLRVYERQTAPLLSFYKDRDSFEIIDASGNIDQVSKSVLKVLE